MKRTLFTAIIAVFILAAPHAALKTYGWTEHPMMVRAALIYPPIWQKADPVEARSLQTFLLENEKELEKFLAEQEAWSVATLPDYAPCPPELAFRATGNADDILLRFYTAIRINPHVKVPLYLHLLPHDADMGRPVADPGEICTL